MAERLRNLKNYIQGVDKGEVEIDHLWPYYVAKYLRFVPFESVICK